MWQSSIIKWVLLLFCFIQASATETAAQHQSEVPTNVVFILSDDHRYDFMGFHENAPEWLKTPAMDRMALEGAHIQNAFVTTSLCSPSRASILTGQYAHNHQVVDNSSPIPEGTRFFPEFVQENDYKTGYIGKWHMGNVNDDPMPGFDHWVSFRGQGVYYNPVLNVDGERSKHEGYTSEILTDYAVGWLKERNKDGDPFFLYLSHKAVHAEFYPAERHRDTYADAEITYPVTMANTESNYRGKPDWVKEQRYSWHGVDYMYHNRPDHPQSLEEIIVEYSETLMGVDNSIGRIMDYLKQAGLAENTLVVYMGDNGFLLGEHGLIDKRNAYEESIRVPMLAWSPGWIEGGTKIDALIRNIDIAPTILELTGTDTPIEMDGESFVDILNGQSQDEDREFLYEYYWEAAFPHTPTTFALRSDRYKYIFYHGVWDRQELYDLQSDPLEQHNLAEIPKYTPIVNEMRNRLFDRLENENATAVPFRRFNWQADEKLIED